jgi:hypothetical protein
MVVLRGLPIKMVLFWGARRLVVPGLNTAGRYRRGKRDANGLKSDSVGGVVKVEVAASSS